MRLDFPYLVTDTDRHGNERIYVRKNGRKVRIRVPIEDKRAFAEAYGAAIDAVESGAPRKEKVPKGGAPAGTLGWFASSYVASTEFTGLDPVSQRTRRGIIEACLAEPRKPGSSDTMKLLPLPVLSPAHIKLLRDRKKSKPAAANNRLKYLSSMCGWGIEQTPPFLRSNPCRDVKPFGYESEGFHTWTAGEVAQFEGRHPVGTKARLAFALMYYLGVRKSDAVLLGRQHVSGGNIRFIPKKTRKKKMDPVVLPIAAELAAIIAACPCGDLTYLVTEYGQPFSPTGSATGSAISATPPASQDAAPTGYARRARPSSPSAALPTVN
jgi:hypothetical protein